MFLQQQRESAVGLPVAKFPLHISTVASFKEDRPVGIVKPAGPTVPQFFKNSRSPILLCQEIPARRTARDRIQLDRPIQGHPFGPDES